MKSKENCATADSDERDEWAGPNLLPDMQALNRDLITHNHFVLDCWTVQQLRTIKKKTQHLKPRRRLRDLHACTYVTV